MNALYTNFSIKSSHVKFLMNCFKKVVVNVLDSLFVPNCCLSS